MASDVVAKAKSLAAIPSFGIESLSPEQLTVIKNTVAKGATDNELQWFLYQCNLFGLNPLLKEIWFIKRVKKVKVGNTWDYPRSTNGEIDYSNADLVIMTSKDGYFKKAAENPEFLSIQSMEVRKNDEFEMGFDGEQMKVSKHSWGKDRGAVIGAWAVVTYKNGSKDWNYVTYEEVCQSYDGKPQGVWATNPTAMIKKTCEVPLLKKAGKLSGITTTEEMENILALENQQSDNNPVTGEIRESAIEKMIQKIEGCKNMEEWDVIAKEITAVAAGLLATEQTRIKEAAKKKLDEFKKLKQEAVENADAVDPNQTQIL